MEKLYPFDYFKQLLSVAIKKQKDKHDSCFIVCGKEGSGKSTLNLHALECFQDITGKETEIHTNMSFNLTEFILGLRDIPYRNMLVLDEGGELASDRQVERQSKHLRNIFTVMREKSLITLITFTNVFRLNTYFREDRAKGLFYVKNRRYVYWYKQGNLMNKIIPNLKKYDSKSISVLENFKPDALLKIEDYQGRLRKEYNKRKRSNIKSILDEMAEVYSVKKEKTYSTNTGRVFVGVNNVRWMELIKGGQVPFTTNAIGTHRYFKESDLLKLREKIRREYEKKQHPVVKVRDAVRRKTKRDVGQVPV